MVFEYINAHLAKDLYSRAYYSSLMAGDSITRRVFLGYSAALPLALESLVWGQAKEDILWENARKNPADGQKVLDETLKGLGAAQKLVSRFYAVQVTEKKSSTTDKWAIVFGDKQLKCYDANAEKSLRETLKKHAETYANSKKDARPETLKEETEKAFKFMTAELLDRAENKEQTTPSINSHLGADAYLQFRLWGTGMPTIGIATRTFFEDKRYKKAEDYKNYLLDHITYGKASDQIDNPPISDVWLGSLINLKLAQVWTEGVGTNDRFTAAIKNRWWNRQAGEIFNKVRSVSDDYAQEMANAWENSVEFRTLVKLHLENSAFETRDPELRESLSDTMGKRCGFKYLPSNSTIVKYDLALVKQYTFEKK